MKKKIFRDHIISRSLRSILFLLLRKYGFPLKYGCSSLKHNNTNKLHLSGTYYVLTL